MRVIKSARALEAERAVSRGLWLAIIGGAAALSAIAIWPQHKHRALFALNYVWLAVMLYMSPRGPKGGLMMTFSELHRKIREEGYRTPFPAALLLLASIVLTVCLLFDPA